MTFASWFGGYYQDPKNNIFSFAGRRLDLLRSLPASSVLPETNCEALSKTRTRRGHRPRARREVWLEDRRHDSDQVDDLDQDATGRPTGASKWSASSRRRATAGQEQRLFFNIDYFDEARTLDKGMVGWYSVRIDSPSHAAAVSDSIDKLFANSDHETKTVTEKEFSSRSSSRSATSISSSARSSAPCFSRCCS